MTPYRSAALALEYERLVCYMGMNFEAPAWLGVRLNGSFIYFSEN